MNAPRKESGFGWVWARQWVQRWRLQAEVAMREQGLPCMSDEQVGRIWLDMAPCFSSSSCFWASSWLYLQNFHMLRLMCVCWKWVCGAKWKWCAERLSIGRTGLVTSGVLGSDLMPCRTSDTKSQLSFRISFCLDYENTAQFITSVSCWCH